jgi:hypothetical protein
MHKLAKSVHSEPVEESTNNTFILLILRQAQDARGVLFI